MDQIRGRVLAAVLGAAFLVSLVYFSSGWYRSGPLEKDATFVVPSGAKLSAISRLLEAKGIVRSARGFANRARVFADASEIKAGEFAIPAHASPSQVMEIITSDDIIRRFVIVPEGMPSVMVYERLMAQPLLAGKVDVPAEGSVLPASYAFERGDTRAAILKRMQAEMSKTLKELWAKRDKNLVVNTPQEAMTLASIVEKETGKPSERRMVAGLYSNRLKIGMPLQADPTIIYPITRGKPLGRRILQSEIRAVNDYNTYSMAGLPRGPITNPGRESIEAVLHPADTDALYMVADGTGGHAFAATLDEHNRNVAKWMNIRRERGEI